MHACRCGSAFLICSQRHGDQLQTATADRDRQLAAAAAARSQLAAALQRSEALAAAAAAAQRQLTGALRDLQQRYAGAFSAAAAGATAAAAAAVAAAIAPPPPQPPLVLPPPEVQLPTAAAAPTTADTVGAPAPEQVKKEDGPTGPELAYGAADGGSQGVAGMDVSVEDAVDENTGNRPAAGVAAVARGQDTRGDHLETAASTPAGETHTGALQHDQGARERELPPSVSGGADHAAGPKRVQRTQPHAKGGLEVNADVCSEPTTAAPVVRSGGAAGQQAGGTGGRAGPTGPDPQVPQAQPPAQPLAVQQQVPRPTTPASTIAHAAAADQAGLLTALPAPRPTLSPHAAPPPQPSPQGRQDQGAQPPPQRHDGAATASPPRAATASPLATAAVAVSQPLQPPSEAPSPGPATAPQDASRPSQLLPVHPQQDLTRPVVPTVAPGADTSAGAGASAGGSAPMATHVSAPAPMRAAAAPALASSGAAPTAGVGAMDVLSPFAASEVASAAVAVVSTAGGAGAAAVTVAATVAATVATVAADGNGAGGREVEAGPIPLPPPRAQLEPLHRNHTMAQKHARQEDGQQEQQEEQQQQPQDRGRAEMQGDRKEGSRSPGGESVRPLRAKRRRLSEAADWKWAEGEGEGEAARDGAAGAGAGALGMRENGKEEMDGAAGWGSSGGNGGESGGQRRPDSGSVVAAEAKAEGGGGGGGVNGGMGGVVQPPGCQVGQQGEERQKGECTQHGERQEVQHDEERHVGAGGGTGMQEAQDGAEVAGVPPDGGGAPPSAATTTAQVAAEAAAAGAEAAEPSAAAGTAAAAASAAASPQEHIEVQPEHKQQEPKGRGERVEDAGAGTGGGEAAGAGAGGDVDRGPAAASQDSGGWQMFGFVGSELARAGATTHAHTGNTTNSSMSERGNAAVDAPGAGAVPVHPPMPSRPEAGDVASAHSSRQHGDAVQPPLRHATPAAAGATGGARGRLWSGADGLAVARPPGAATASAPLSPLLLPSLHRARGPSSSASSDPGYGRSEGGSRHNGGDGSLQAAQEVLDAAEAVVSVDASGVQRSAVAVMAEEEEGPRGWVGSDGSGAGGAGGAGVVVHGSETGKGEGPGEAEGRGGSGAQGGGGDGGGIGGGGGGGGRKRPRDAIAGLFSAWSAFGDSGSEEGED